MCPESSNGSWVVVDVDDDGDGDGDRDDDDDNDRRWEEERVTSSSIAALFVTSRDDDDDDEEEVVPRPSFGMRRPNNPLLAAPPLPTGRGGVARAAALERRRHIIRSLVGFI